MKEVIDTQGKKVEVPKNSPIKTINGVHYLLTPKDVQEIEAKEQAWRENAIKRETAAVIFARKKLYGTAEEQLEYIAENGLEAWRQRIQDIKLANPKPE